MKIFEVGGYVRDRLMGLIPKDIDYTVECPEGWDHLVNWVTETHKQVFLVKPEFLTIRALWEKGDVRDYVMARKDGIYFDGRRPESVEPGTLMDDLARRDFTMNAMAVDIETKELIDPFNGRSHIKRKIIHCVGATEDRFNEDLLRPLRAIRFAVTKSMALSEPIDAWLNCQVNRQKLSTVEPNRIREELMKACKVDYELTFGLLSKYGLWKHITHGGLWFKPTNEEK